MTDQTTVPEVSIVICTYNRGNQIIPTLQSLADQSTSLKIEVIIVDNNTPPNTNVHKAHRWFLENSNLSNPNQLKYIHCYLSGLSHARNAGIANSKCEIICFLDDDAIALPDWIDTIVKAFEEHPQTGVMGGHILLKVPEPRPKALLPGFEKFWSQFTTNYSQYTEVESWKDFPWGANWCVRRTAILDAGGFDENYGRGSLGRKYWCGEELAAALKIQRLGYRIAIEPGAIVFHDVDRSRYSFLHVWNTILADKLVRYQMQKDGILNEPRIENPIPLFKQFQNFSRAFISFLGYAKSPILFLMQICAHGIFHVIKMNDLLRGLFRPHTSSNNTDH